MPYDRGVKASFGQIPRSFSAILGDKTSLVGNVQSRRGSPFSQSPINVGQENGWLGMD